MPINPFIIPAGLVGGDRLTPYWLATVTKAQYEVDPARTRALYLDFGAVEHVRIAVGNALLPRIDIGFFPSNRAVVAICGTNSWQQWLGQVLAFGQIVRPPWPGQVGNTHSALAVLCWPLVKDWLQTFDVQEVAVVGHSLGGAVAQLMCWQLVTDSSVSPVVFWTFGSPRCGNPAYAAQMQIDGWRLHNQGDPVALVPPSVSPILNQFTWLLEGVTVGNWLHWGSRAVLMENGGALYPPGDLPGESGAVASLAQFVLASQAWFAAHDPLEYARRLRLGFDAVTEQSAEVSLLDGEWQEIAGDLDLIEKWFDPRTCR